MLVSLQAFYWQLTLNFSDDGDCIPGLKIVVPAVVGGWAVLLVMMREVCQDICGASLER